MIAEKSEVGSRQSEAGTGWAPSLGALIVLAVGFRLPALFLIRYGGTAPDWSDFLYYHELAGLAAQGFLPDIHFWVEYPPLFPWLAVGAYRLSLLLPGWTQPYFWFDLILTVVLAAADAGSILLIDRLGDACWGDGGGRRCAAIYAALFLPAYAILGWFDTLPTFFLLLALALIVTGRPPAARRGVFAGVAIGVGAMLKLFPLLALPAALLPHSDAAGQDLEGEDDDPHPNPLPEGEGARPRPRWIPASAQGVAPSSLSLWERVGVRVVVLLSTLLTILLIALPFFLLGRGTFLATFQNVVARGSWMSPWAILDGYYGTGTVAALSDRLYYNASALWGQPARYPWLWWLAVAIAGVVYVRRWRAAARADTPGDAVALTAFGVALLLLLNRGFSTQFTVWLLPFVALLLPGLDGAILVVLLTLVDLVLEGYLYVSLFPTLHRLLWVSAGARTLLLLWFAVESGTAIDPKSALRWANLQRRLAWPSAGAAAILAVVSALLVGPGLGAAVAAQNGSAALAPVLATISPDAAVVFTQPTVYDRLDADVRPRPAFLLAEPGLLKWTGDRSLDHRLTTDLAGTSDVVLVTDSAQPGAATAPAVQSWLGARYGAEPERKVGTLGLVVYRQSLRPAEQPDGARFGPAITLVGHAPASLAVAPGSSLAVTLHWKAEATPDRDYTVSLQLLDPSGKLAAQHDAMPASNAEPTSGWQPGQEIYDPTSLVVPPQSPPGRYHLIVVVYDNQTSRRLPVTGAGAAGDHAELTTVAVR